MENEEFKKRIGALSDEELIGLLRIRESYQEEAVAIALQEAITRGLVSSEKELEKPEFNAVKTYPKSIFPKLDTDAQFQKTFASLVRILYLIALVPLVFGVLGFVEGKMAQGIFLSLSGVLWILSAIQLQKQKDRRMPIVLMFIFLATIAFISIRQPEVFSFQLKDLFVYGLLFFGILYILVYLRILLSGRKRTESFR
jgi:hypothetical protein